MTERLLAGRISRTVPLRIRQFQPPLHALAQISGGAALCRAGIRSVSAMWLSGAWFFRVRCEGCRREQLLAFSCKRRVFCPSCGARRMAESAALWVDEVFPDQPVRQWVLSIPIPLRFCLRTGHR